MTRNEYLKVTFEDLAGTHALHGVSLGPVLPSTSAECGLAYGKYYTHRWYPLGASGYDDYREDTYPGYSHYNHFLTLLLDDGRFSFPQEGLSTRIMPYGIWEPHVVSTNSPLAVVELRMIPSREANWRSMYAVDESSGLVILEFGTHCKADDPNLRREHSRYRWENGEGWDSPLLHPEPDVSGVEIKRPYAFTPKRTGSGYRGSRKARF